MGLIGKGNKWRSETTKGILDQDGIRDARSPSPTPDPLLPLAPVLRQFTSDKHGIQFFVNWMATTSPTVLNPTLLSELRSLLTRTHARGELHALMLEAASRMANDDARTRLIDGLLGGAWLELLPVEPPK